MSIQDENGNPLIGYVDIGGVVIERAGLAEVLPNIHRFERNLELARRIDAYMTEHDGAIPPVIDTLSETQRGEVVQTLGELGQLRFNAAQELREASS